MHIEKSSKKTKKMKLVHSEPLILKYRSATYIFYYFYGYN